jgi:hypothetical protein
MAMQSKTKKSNTSTWILLWIRTSNRSI